MSFDVKKLKQLPDRPGIYKYLNQNKEVIYVGKALSLKSRVASYWQKDASPKTTRLVADIWDVETIETGSEFEALLLEARLIKLFRPKYNISQKDDKSYLYIFITTSEEFPKILLTRRPKSFLESSSIEVDTYEGIKGVSFGPFPSAAATRGVLKMIRRIFPYCQQPRVGKRGCFYSHIGLCSPCPSDIVKQVGEERKHLTKRYRYNIFSIKKILEGKLPEVTKSLEKEMQQAAKQEEFETAARLRNQLKYLEYITTTRDTSAYFLENENFYFDRQQSATDELRSILERHFPKLGELGRIECFDISNLSGTNAVAAQVTFINGIPEKSQYRKYRIKTITGPNDFGMLAEAVKRRISHTEWSLPDLVVIDGGKAQVSTIVKLFEALHMTIPVIGLAKRLEKIVIGKSGLDEITLPRKSAALKLLQQLRDETHRFAITYHKKRRALDFLTT